MNKAIDGTRPTVNRPLKKAGGRNSFFPLHLKRIGKYFYSDPTEGKQTMWLNFTMTDEDIIDRAVRTLSEVIARES